MAAARTPAVRSLEPVDTKPNREAALFSRHETLLATGARLFRAQGYPRSAPARSARAPGSRAPVFTARSRPNRPFSTHSSVGSTSGEASNPCAHYAANGTETERLGKLVEGTSRSAWTTPDLVAVSITELSHASSEVRDGYTAKRGRPRSACGSTSSASWFRRPLSPRHDCSSRRRSASSTTSREPGTSALRRCGGRDHRPRAVNPDQPRSPQRGKGSAVGDLSRPVHHRGIVRQ